MHNFTYWNPTKLIFGRGEVERLPEELKSYGKNVLLVYGGGSIKRSGLYDQVIEQLNKAGVTVHELAGVEPNPR
ncbi:iron-containing alcohol dehydrogenase, partial [Bacillus spizizenii]|nr:iron-containing alcohol dehydrogenase [Bacillus spizizenii]